MIASRQFQRSPELLAAILLAIASTLWAWWTGYHMPTFGDFVAFHRSGWHWRAGVNPYVVDGLPVNLNTPLSLVLFTPFSMLSFHAAYILWAGLGLLCVAWSLYRIPASLTAKAWALAWLLGAIPGMWSWREGGITWLFFPLVTEAWRASRAGRLTVAGCWLAPIIAIKPTMALFALALPWPIWLAAGFLSASLALLGVLVLGWPIWAHWFAMAHVINWGFNPMNASIYGLQLRFLWPVGVTVALVCVVLLLRPWFPKADHDTRWILAILWATLLSPLGWITYTPVVTGPVLAKQGGSPFFRWLLVLQVLPWTVVALVLGHGPIVESFAAWSVWIALGYWLSRAADRMAHAAG